MGGLAAFLSAGLPSDMYCVKAAADAAADMRMTVL